MSFGFGFALPAYPLRGGGGNNPFNQSGPTLDLSFAGVVTDNTDPNGYTLTTNFITPQYQVAAQYTIWETGVGLVDKTFSQIITFTRASTATFTGSNGLIQSAAIDAPRFDYDPVTFAAKGLLIEEQRTNLQIRSEEFNSSPWTPTNLSTVTANSSTAPDGTMTADLLVSAVGAGVTGIAITSFAFSALTYTQSVFVKAATGVRYIQLLYTSGTTSNDHANFDLQTGTVTAGTYSSASMTNFGNGWYRISMTSIATAFTSGVWIIAVPAAASARGAAYTGNGTDGFCVWGAQLEAGSFPTSYIPTVASQVTRSADVAAVNTLSPWYNATEGTLYAEFTPYGVTSDVRFASIDDNTSANRILIWGSSTSSSTRYEVLTGGAAQVTLTAASTLTANATTKAAAAYKVNDFAFSVNGGAAVLDPSGTVPAAVTKLTIGGSAGATVSNGAIRRITYYPRKLSSAELQAITA